MFSYQSVLIPSDYKLNENTKWQKEVCRPNQLTKPTQQNGSNLRRIPDPQSEVKTRNQQLKRDNKIRSLIFNEITIITV